MSDEIRLPSSLLPPERCYRPTTSSFVITAFVAAFVLAWPCSWVLGRVSIWWVMNVETWYLYAILIGLFILVGVRRNARLQRILQQNFDAVALLDAGNTADAGRRLDDLCQRAPRELAFHAMVVFNRGIVFLREGRPDRALSLFAAVLDSGMLAKPRESFYTFYPSLLAGIATACAVRGDTAEAERWQGLAHEHVSVQRAAALLLLDVYLGARTGRNEVVVKDAEAALPDAGWLPTAQTQAVRIVCAFALAQVNRQDCHAAKIKQFLEGARPCRPGQFDYLAVAWPELRAFLVENGFSEAAKKA